MNDFLRRRRVGGRRLGRERHTEADSQLSERRHADGAAVGREGFDLVARNERDDLIWDRNRTQNSSSEPRYCMLYGAALFGVGAFQPHDQLYVYEEDGRLAGLARVERDTDRDEWTVVELDAIDHGDAGDIRFRLVQHLLRDGSRRGAARFHVACAFSLLAASPLAQYCSPRVTRWLASSGSRRARISYCSIAF